MTSTKETPRDLSQTFSRLAYGGFVLLSIYYFFSNDVPSAVTNLGIALVFDPFDQKVSFSKRPLYQRIWLIVHLIVLLGLFGYMLAQ